MKKENILVIALICIALAGVLTYNQTRSLSAIEASSDENNTVAATGDSINWIEFDSGMKMAHKSNKPIFLYFYADWCTYCVKLKKTTFKNKTILNYLKNHFISIKVNTDIEKELATNWKVRGLPTSWFLESDASQIDSIPGYMDEEQFLTILKYINTKSYDKMSFNDFVKSI